MRHPEGVEKGKWPLDKRMERKGRGGEGRGWKKKEGKMSLLSRENKAEGVRGLVTRGSAEFERRHGVSTSRAFPRALYFQKRHLVIRNESVGRGYPGWTGNCPGCAGHMKLCCLACTVARYKMLTDNVNLMEMTGIALDRRGSKGRNERRPDQKRSKVYGRGERLDLNKTG